MKKEVFPIGSMISVGDIIKVFRQMYQEHWPYSKGAATKGCVDCSGAFVYAYRLFGKTIAHGSNAIARKHVEQKLPISQAEPGMAALKLLLPSEAGYDLPEKYRQGGAAYNGDLNDYYHIGLVDSDPNYVLNAKGEQEGFCRSKIKDGWDCVAYLKQVNYEERRDDPMPEQQTYARVVLPEGASGSTVNLRASASKSGKIVRRVPVGTVVNVLTDQEFWCEIETDGVSGWMMSNYLEYAGQGGESGDEISPEIRERLSKAFLTISDAVVQIQRAVESVDDILMEG